MIVSCKMPDSTPPSERDAPPPRQSVPPPPLLPPQRHKAHTHTHDAQNKQRTCPQTPLMVRTPALLKKEREEGKKEEDLPPDAADGSYASLDRKKEMRKKKDRTCPQTPLMVRRPAPTPPCSSLPASVCVCVCVFVCVFCVGVFVWECLCVCVCVCVCVHSRTQGE